MSCWRYFCFWRYLLLLALLRFLVPCLSWPPCWFIFFWNDGVHTFVSISAAWRYCYVPLLLGPCCCCHLCRCGIPLAANAESPFCCLRPWCFCCLCCWRPCCCRCPCLCPWCFEFLLTFLLFLASLLHASAGYFLCVHDPSGVLIGKAFLAIFWYRSWCPCYYWRPCSCMTSSVYCWLPLPWCSHSCWPPCFLFHSCDVDLCCLFCLHSVPALASILNVAGVSFALMFSLLLFSMLLISSMMLLM